MLPWHHFLWIRSADGCGVAFSGPSDAPCGSSVISDSTVSTETRTQWAGKQSSCKKMTSPSPTLSDSSSSSKHDGNQVSVCADLKFSKSVCLKIFLMRHLCFSRLYCLLLSRCLIPGQLGDYWGAQGFFCQCAGTWQTGGLPAQEEEVAHERLA